VLGDVAHFLEDLEAVLDAKPVLPKRDAWSARVKKWHTDYPPVTDEHRTKVPGKINSYHFIDVLSDLLGPEHVIVTDMGTSLTCTHAAIRLKDGQRLITSTGLGEMGFGLPGALGASFAAEGRPVVFIGVEGSLMMNLQELQTLKHHALPLKVFILNNDGYLTIKHTERALFGERFTACGPESGVTFPDMEGIAKGFGLPFTRLSDSATMKTELKKLLAAPGVQFVDVTMPQDQFLGPKTAVKVAPDGTLTSPPLEDLAPFLGRDELEKAMVIPLLPASKP
jgi:acetolactate synthase I/II/III large subunit